MAAQIYSIHHETPQAAKLYSLREVLRESGVILMPSDTGMSLVCNLADKQAISSMRRIRNMKESQQLTFLCSSLSNIAEYAQVNNRNYKLIKRLIPGPYTFVLPGSKGTPKYAQHAKKKTVGIRVPDHALCLGLLETVGHPLICISARSEELPLADTFDIIEEYEPKVDAVVTCPEFRFAGESTVLDLTGDELEVIREGAGPIPV